MRLGRRTSTKMLVRSMRRSWMEHRSRAGRMDNAMVEFRFNA